MFGAAMQRAPLPGPPPRGGREKGASALAEHAVEAGEAAVDLVPGDPGQGRINDDRVPGEVHAIDRPAFR